MRIGTIHATLNAVGPLERAVSNADASAVVCNFVNEELLYHANQVNGVDEWGMRNFMRLIMQAAESSVDGIIIACSLYSSYVEEARMFTGKPVIAIDQPMIEKAVQCGSYIGILATTASAGPAEEKKILKEAKRKGKEIKTEVAVNTEAMEALKLGDQKKHDALLKMEGIKLKEKGCDLLVLSQITMAGAEDEVKQCGLPVISSPKSGAEEMISRIKQGM